MTTQAERDARFMRSVLAASDDCIKVLDLDGRLTFMSEGGQRVMEVQDFGKLQGCHWPGFWTDDGHVEAKAAIAAAKAGQSYRFQGPANTAAGNPRQWDVQVSPIIGPDGLPEAILSVSRDITQLRESLDRYRLLAGELNHRIKNMLAMVQGVVNQTLRAGGEAIAPLRAQLGERIGALGRAQDILMATTQAEADLAALVASVLEPHGVGERFQCEGPPVRLAPRAATAMAMAVHELATNALKYGALSDPRGEITLTWRIESDRFRLEWRERNGPPVAQPTRKGFGSHVIEKALSGYLGGNAAISYEPEGIVLMLDAPVEGLTASY